MLKVDYLLKRKTLNLVNLKETSATVRNADTLTNRKDKLIHLCNTKEIDKRESTGGQLLTCS